MMTLTRKTSLPRPDAPASGLPLASGRALFGRRATIVLFALLGIPAAAARADDPPIPVKIRNHQFIPAEIEIPAGEKRQLVIENQDPTVEEFESHTLHREKIIPANSKVNVYVGPLKPGRYEFQGEFNEATAKGAVVAK